MPIKNLGLPLIEGRRFARRDEQIRQLNIDISTSITPINQTAEDEAQVRFRHQVSYRSVGVINIEGELTFVGDAAALMADWQENKNMPEETARELHQAIMNVCIPESVIIARDLNLTMPIPPINLNLKKGKKGTVDPVHGMEVA